MFKAEVQKRDDKSSKQINRFGFLYFVSQEEANRCQQEMNNTMINGNTVRISLY